MKSRPAGLLLVVAALAVAGLSSSVTQRIDGLPRMGVTVAAPPVVGSCVAGDPTPRGLDYGVVPSAALGPCDQPHRGEVVLVAADAARFPSTAAGSRPIADLDACRRFADAYLGVDQVSPRADRGDAASRSYGSWLPAGTGELALIGPDAVQRQLGQRWIACVTKVPGPPYRGTVRAAFTGGRLPDGYAVCTRPDSVDVRSTVPCSGPHQVEVFATTGLIYLVPMPDRLVRSCTQLVREFTGLDDVTAGGALAVRFWMAHFDAEGHAQPGYPTQENQEPSEGTCAVQAVGPRMLTATLFALGHRPLPLR